MEQLSTRLVGVLWPGRGAAQHDGFEPLDTPPHAQIFWQRWQSASGRKAAIARLGIPPSRRDVAHSIRGAWRTGRHPVKQEALNNRILKRYGLITQTDLASLDQPRVVSNRRMRKTARPVVWKR
jgi:hypothetical protein